MVEDCAPSNDFALRAESTHTALGINWQLARWPAQNQTNNSPARTYPERLDEWLDDRRRAHVARQGQQRAYSLTEMLGIWLQGKELLMRTTRVAFRIEN